MPMRSKKPTPIEWFWAHVEKQPNDGCWVWTGETVNDYGRMRINGKRVLAHRFAYETFVGELPPDIIICHHCDNHPCVRPDHLFAGSPIDNSHDMVSKGRELSGERNPRVKLTEIQVREIRGKFASGAVSKPQLAAEYEISLSTIHAIIVRRIWKLVA
jgi:hypothetical protein